MKRRNFLIVLLGAAGTFLMSPFRAVARFGCRTTADVSGPFHRPGAPYRHDLSLGYSKASVGKPLEVRGTVYGADCETPLRDAELDLWHADPTGEYDMHSDLFLFRARIKMDSDGNYRYTTLMPAHYSDAGLNRPKHIHYIISAPGHRTLVTQLYFQGDERLADDPFVQQNDGMTRAMAFAKDAKGVYQMKFDIYLDAS